MHELRINLCLRKDQLNKLLQLIEELVLLDFENALTASLLSLFILQASEKAISGSKDQSKIMK